MTQMSAAAAEESTIPQNSRGNTQAGSPSGLVQAGSPSGLVNPLGEPLNTSTPKGSSGSGSGKSGSRTSGVSSVRSRCEIAKIKVGKGLDGEDYAYILAGIDEKREQKYGERVYAHTIHPLSITCLERVGNPTWGFFPVDKLPRWRKVVRGIVGFITFTGGTALLVSIVGPIPAVIISAAAALGVRKLFTLGRSVKLLAETDALNLTGCVPKRDYDIFERLVRGTADYPSGAEAAGSVGTC